MSVTIVANVAANTGIASVASSTNTEGALPVDFAALLSAQAIGVNESPSLNTVAGALEKTANVPRSNDAIDKSNGETLDPSVLASLFGLPLQPPMNVQTQNQGRFMVEKQENEVSIDNFIDHTKQQTIKANTNVSTAEAESSISSNSVVENQRQISALASEAANIAAPSATTDTGTSSFALAMGKAPASSEGLLAKQPTISAPLNTPTWPAQFGEKIVWMAKSDQQSAQININPPQLGPIQITLNLNGDQANAVFASPNAEVRQAIETALPQLKEMLSFAGISLGDTSVGANLSQQSQQPPPQSANKAQLTDENAILPASANTASSVNTQIIHRGRGLVDLFA